MAKVYLQIDASELSSEIRRLQMAMTPQQFNNAMAGIFRRTGSHVKKIMRTDLPTHYNIPAAEVGRAVGGAKMAGGGIGGVGCTIPVRAARRHIGGGGKGFPAKGGRRGWNSLRSGPYKITATIYRGSSSTLPSHMGSYGGQPPFRNLGSSLNGITFTRTGKPRLPIRSVMGIAIPQMPLNKAEPDVQKDIKDYMFKQMEHRLQGLIASGR